MLTPLYRALLEASLSCDGVLEPCVSAGGRFSDESGGDLLNAEDGLALICQATVRADAAIGTTVGREVLQSLAQSVGVEGLLDARYDDLSREGHAFSNDELGCALHDAARAFSSQRPI